MREVTLHADYPTLEQETIDRLYDEVNDSIEREQSGYASLALPETVDAERFNGLAEEHDHPEAVVTIGMGGSVRSSKAVTSALGLTDHYALDSPDPRRVEEVLDAITVEETVFHIASQSGATRETIAIFNAVKQELDRDGYNITDRAVVTTRAHSPLEEYAENHGIPTFRPSLRVTGRFSVFSAVGLLPVALLGGDVESLLAGGREALDEFEPTPDSPPFAVAGLLEHAMDDGYANVALLPYASGFEPVASWFVQLWSESLGDEDAAPSEPIHAEGPAVQHARLQQLLSGATRTLPMFVVFDDYGSMHNLTEVMQETYEATRDALTEAGVPSLAYNLSNREPTDVGWLLMTLELVTTVVGVNRDIPVFKNAEVNAIKTRLTTATFDEDVEE